MVNISNTSASLEIFRDARSRTTHWEKLVDALNQLEATSPADEQGRPWAKVAAQLSGYSVNQLRQMQRTLASLEALHTEARGLRLASTLLAVPFSHLEILVRIAKFDPDVAIKYLQSAGTQNRPPTYRELRERFYELRDKTPQHASPIAVGLRTSRQFENICLDLLVSNHGEPLYRPQAVSRCERRIVRWPGAFRYASPDLLIESRARNQTPQIDAADCFIVYGDVSQDETMRRIQRIAFEASFFTCFWIMLPTWSPGWLFESLCKRLRIRNVGVVAIDPETRIIAHVSPPIGAPEPDRREILYEEFAYLRSR